MHLPHVFSSPDWVAWSELRHIVTGSGFLWVSVTTLCAAAVEKHPRLTPKPLQAGSAGHVRSWAPQTKLNYFPFVQRMGVFNSERVATKKSFH